MSIVIENRTVSTTALWTGRVISGIVVAFLIPDAAIKLVPIEIVTRTMLELGWPATVSMARLLGILTLAGTLLYVWPRTAVLGAILLTAYLGGAVATHVRIGNPLFTHTLFGVYLGIFIWGGLYLRDPRVRALIPFSS